MKNFIKFFIYSFLVLLISSCKSPNDHLTIALSKGYPYDNYQFYHKWVANGDSTAQVIELYNRPFDEALSKLEECQALIITGGPDVYPGKYGKESDTARCGTFDFKRDSLEFALIKKALELEMPIFGICRGEQILNVAMGGSLIIDIPTDHDTLIKHNTPDWKLCFHDVYIEPGTKIAWVTNVISGNVSSSHHQAIDQIADVFKVVARSTNGIVEAIEWKEPENKSFLMAVQWHPEMMNYEEPLSKGLIDLLIYEAKRYQETNLD